MSKMYARPLAMTVLAISLAAGAAGCQTMSDLDPTGLLGDDTSVPESQFPTESAQQAEADANTTTPDLASIPTESEVRVLEVTFANGARAVIPRTNIEVIEGSS